MSVVSCPLTLQHCEEMASTLLMKKLNSLQLTSVFFALGRGGVTWQGSTRHSIQHAVEVKNQFSLSSGHVLVCAV